MLLDEMIALCNIRDNLGHELRYKGHTAQTLAQANNDHVSEAIDIISDVNTARSLLYLDADDDDLPTLRDKVDTNWRILRHYIECLDGE